MEREPVRFFLHEMEPLLDQSRQTLAALLGADPAGLVFVRNATSGANSVLRSLSFDPGDEILITNHGYNACRNVVEYVALRCGAKVVAADVPFPLAGPHQVLESVLASVSQRTRLAVLDHITSPTAILFPIAKLVHELSRRGVDSLVDGAHAPGMVPLDLRRLGAAYYAGNCHKWLCCPKGSAFLYVRPDRQEAIQPPVISHGYNTRRPDRSRLHDAFDWTGTDDPTPWLCVGEAIRFLDRLGQTAAGPCDLSGIERLMRRNHELAVSARQVLCEALGQEPPCPEEMLGAMAAVALCNDANPAALTGQTPPPVARLQSDLLDRFGIEMPLLYWPAPPHRLLRVSAAAYNHLEQYGQLVEVLVQLKSESRI